MQFLTDSLHVTYFLLTWAFGGFLALLVCFFIITLANSFGQGFNKGFRSKK